MQLYVNELTVAGGGLMDDPRKWKWWTWVAFAILVYTRLIHAGVLHPIRNPDGTKL